jgi:hypothetical protein
MTQSVYDELREKLQTATKSTHPKGMVSKLADAFEDAFLEETTIPDGAFDLFVEIFSDERLCKLPGLSWFIGVFFTDFDKLSEAQRGRLLEVFSAGSAHYSDEMTRHAIGDFIARKYSPEQAVSCFSAMMRTASAHAKQIALTGTDILMKRTPSSSPLYEQIDAIWSEAQQ